MSGLPVFLRWLNVANTTTSIVRMSTWRGCITISGEWKECDYDSAMITRFLDDMVEIMLSIIEHISDSEM